MNEDPQSNTENNVGPRPDHQLGQEDRTLDSQTLSMQSEGDMSSPSFMSDDENGLHPGVVMKPPQQYRRNEASILEEDERADQSDQQQQQQGSIPGESLASFASLMIDDDRQLPPTIPRHVSPGAMSMAGPVVAPQSKPLIPGATAPAASEHMSDSISMDSQSSFASLIHTDDDDDAHHHHPHPHPSALVSSMSRSNAYAYASNPKTTSTTVRPGEMAAMGPATVLQSGKPPTDANMGDGDKLASSWTPPRRPIPPGIEAMPPLTQHSDPGASMTSSTTLGGDVSEASTFVTSTPTKQRRFTTPSAGTTTPNTTTRSRRISARQQTKFDPGDSPAGSISAPFSPLRTPPRSDSTKTRRWTTPDSFQQRQQQQSFTSSGDDSVLSSNIGSVAACGSHRSETHTAAAAAARSLIEEQEDFNAQEDDEDPELTNDELMLSDQPGAFAVDRSERGNTIRARVKDTDRHLSTLPLVQSQSSSHASSTNQLQLGLSANWIGGNSRQDVNGANTLATEDVESPHSGTSARYDRNTSIQYDTNMPASLPSQTQPGVLTAASTPILPSSLGRVDATNVNAVEDVDPKSSSSWKRYRWIVVASGLIFLAMAIAIPVILTAGKGAEHVRPNHQTTPTAAPVVAATASPTTAAPTSLERFQAFSDVIRANSTSNAVDLTTEGSPQYRAAKWLADQDPAQLDPSNTSLAQEIRDRYVAVVVYYSIGLNTKPHSQAYWWLTADSICKWNAVLDNTTYAQGISCMDNVTVTKLVVEQANVAGTIPTEIAHFSLLQTLDLSQNDLQGSIPTEIGDCLLLNFLDLSGNGITGKLPTTFSNDRLPDLRVLGLSLNLLTGTVTSGLLSMSNLEILLIHRNNLSNGIPSEIGMMKGLTVLDLGENPNLGSTIPTQIGNLTNLQFLKLSQSGFTGGIPTELGRLTNLEDLDLSSNAIDGTIPMELAELTQLTSVDLFINFLTGSIPDLSNWTNLTEFNFQLNGLTGSVDELCHSNPNLATACVDNAIVCSCCASLDSGCIVA